MVDSNFRMGQGGGLKKFFSSLRGGGEGAKEPDLSPGSATGLKVFKSYTVSSQLFLERTNPIK